MKDSLTRPLPFDNLHQHMSFLQFIWLLLIITVQIMFFKYLVDLEKTGCKCAMDWRRTYMIAFFAWSFVNVILLYSNASIRLKMMSLTITSAMGVLNVVFMLQYIHRLKATKCSCSRSIYREIMYIYSILVVLAFTALALWLLAFVVMQIVLSFSK